MRDKESVEWEEMGRCVEHVCAMRVKGFVGIKSS